MSKQIKLKKNSKVYWNDPIDLTSGMYKILCDVTLENKEDDKLILIGNGHTETEVYFWELELETKVVFRKLKDTKEVVALFPEIPWGNTLTAYYMHVGQHGAGDYDMFIRASTPATKQEYKSLLNELKQVGYKNLQIIKKCRPKYN